MIVLPSVNAGTRSSYGIEKKIRYSYGYSFNYGYNISYYLPDYDPALAYFYADVLLYYLKVDNKVIVNNNGSNYIFLQDDYLNNTYYRNDGYGVRPVGCIDQINSYLKNIYKINDFTFYPGGEGVVLKSSIGRKMILTIYYYVYMEYDGSAVDERAIPWTLYINYPYDITNQTPSMLEMVDVINPSWNGYISYFYGLGGAPWN
jgi:hypothetical protein